MSRDGHPGGTHLKDTAHRCWGRQQGLVGAAMEARNNAALEDAMCAEARRLNLAHLELYKSGHCPYDNGCDKPGVTPPVAPV